MKRLRRVLSFSNVVVCIAFLALLPELYAQGNRWDPEGAARAFEDAGRMRSELSKATLPVLSQYLECAKTYRKVHVRDPHYSRTGDAIYQEGLIYQEMGDKFAGKDFYRTAVKRFQLLISDYGGNQNCADALLRTGDIYLNPLDDEVAAQNAYRLLRANYKNSSSSRQLAARGSISPLPAPPPVAPLLPAAVVSASPSAKSVPAETAFVQSIRHWSNSDYTRVIIDLDSTALYSGKRLSNPDRIYFDISKAKLSGRFGTTTLPVDDEFLKQIRISQNNRDTVRVVLELSKKGDHTVSEMRDPFRIVVDLRGSGAGHSALRTPPADAGQSSSKPKVAQSAPAKLPESGAGQPPRAITEIHSVPLKAQKPAPAASAQTAAAGVPRPEGSAEKAKPAEPASKQPVVAVQGGGATSLKPPLEAESIPVSTKTAKPSTIAPAASDGTADAAKLPPASAARPAAPTSRGDRTMTRMLGLKIGRIVIDPGHGGHDLGTVGPGGMLEKDLVLSIALDLQRLLEDNLGAQVLLTRSDDTFISLEERSAMANRFRADLFISIHANSSRSRTTSGVETYYLNFAGTNAEREIACRENATSSSNVSELENLIKKIAQTDKATESKELASIIQQRLFSGIKKISPATQNRGVRRAPFIVLIGANMPSILTEVAFISNPRDERLLKKASNQERLVKALFSGIEDYMKTLGSDVAQIQPHVN